MNSHVARMVARLDERAATISDILCTTARDNVPELPRDGAMSTLMRSAMRDHLHTIFVALLHDIDVTKITAPPTHVEYAKALARRDVPIDAMMRGHRLGQHQLSEVVLAELQALGMAPESQAAVIETLARTLLKYVDVVSKQALAAYQGEHRVRLEARRIARALQIRDVLDGTPFDVDAVSCSNHKTNRRSRTKAARR